MKILKRKTLAALLALSLLASLLPLGAQPVLAAAPDGQVLYVGGVQISSTGYWTTDDSGNVTVYSGEGAPTDNYIHYNAANNTLTLHNATIKEEVPLNTSTYVAGAAIGVHNQNGAAELTITLEGTNTIAEVGKGIYVLASSTGEATLTITSESGGSLDASGSSNPGIWVQSNSGNASLSIKDADVEATGTSYGVNVQSHKSSTASLTVDGGSLTASGSPGILYDSSGSGTVPKTTALTISNSAIVDARGGGIGAGYIVNLSGVSPTDDSVGIVFGHDRSDSNAGTVYGSVTLQENLTIGEGESLTIGDEASLIVPNGKTLTNNGTIDNGGTLTNSGTVTNNGTINVEDGGKLEGTPTGGTVVNAPTIGTQPVSQTVTTGNTATFTIAASGENLSYKWQQSTDNGTNWNNISGATSNSYTTEAATTGMSGTQYRCVVSNSAGSVTSNAATLTVDPVSVAGVTLNETELALYTGGSATLTAKVEPADATNQAVTWSSENEAIATVDNNGNVTAEGEGETTITVKTVDGNHTATCTVKVTEPSYSITADPTALNFGSAYTGYAQPAAKTVTLTNTGNQPVTLNQPSSTDNFVVGNLTDTELVAGETATFKVQPKAGLAAGTYSDTITVSDTNNNVTSSITASFTVKSRPSYNPPTVSEKTTDAIADAQPGETVTVDLSSGSTKLDKEVFETLAGKDVTLGVDLGDGLSWTVNGSDVPEDADFTDIDMGVTMNSDGIPVEVVNAITGERDSVQITLAHDGEFGFTMTLTAPLGKENAGYWANLYHYDEADEQLTFEAAAKIDEDGSVTIPFSHASQYAIVIDAHSHATVDVSDLFIDIAPDAWYKDAIQYAYAGGLMTGVSDTEFAPEATTTRAMIVSILARLENVTTAEAAGFADVDDNEWYATAVNWAASVGVVNGYEDNTFRPNTAITREQLAAILMNYASYKGEDVSNRADLSAYSDTATISSWANDVMQWAVAEGLISGVTNDQLQPQSSATRAQVAAILQRLLEA